MENIGGFLCMGPHVEDVRSRSCSADRTVSYLRHPRWDDGAAAINQPSEILFSLPLELYI